MQYKFTYKPERLVYVFDTSPTGETADVSYFMSPGFSSLQPGPLVKGDFRTPNPWSYIKQHVEYIHGTFTRSNSAGRRHMVGTLLEASGSFAYDYTRNQTIAYNMALSQLLGKLAGSLNLAVSAAEGRQTVKMLNLVERYTSAATFMQRSWKRQVANKLRAWKSKRAVTRGIRNWQRGVKLRYPRAYRSIPVNRGIVSKASAAGANGWLEFTYGLSPLVSDVRGVAENLVGWSRNVATARGRGFSPITTDQRTSIVLEGRNYTGKCMLTGFVLVELKVRALAGFDPDHLKWTSINPLGIGYELLPFSFVYDWVVDLGGYMENLEKSMQYSSRFSDGYHSTLVKLRYQTAINSRVSNNGVSFVGASGLDEQVTFSRSLLTAFPSPIFPRLAPDLGSRRLLSAASLLRQLIR